MKNWSNKQHEEILRLKREKKRIDALNKQLNLSRNNLPTTVYLDNNSNELSTAIYTNDGINYYDGNGNKVNIKGK